MGPHMCVVVLHLQQLHAFLLAAGVQIEESGLVAGRILHVQENAANTNLPEILFQP